MAKFTPGQLDCMRKMYASILTKKRGRHNMSEEDLRQRYGASENGNFYVKDTLGVPHPYCIGAKHVAHAADHFGGILGEAAIEDGERKKIFKCETPRCTLPFAKHERALLVACKAEIKAEDGKADPELHAYLLKCKPLCEADKFAGFAFIKE